MSDSRDPIVFTGSGIVCGAGSSVAEVWEKLASGETAVRPFTQFDPAISRKGSRFHSRAAWAARRWGPP